MDFVERLILLCSFQCVFFKSQISGHRLWLIVILRHGRPGKIWAENSDCFLFQNGWFFLGVIWAYNFLWKKLVRAKTNQIENILFRDLRTKTDRSHDQEKIENLEPDQDQTNFENLGPIRTWWSVYPWSYWSNCCHFQYRQCIIAVCMEWLNYQVINRLRWSSYSDRIMVRVSASEFFWIDMPEKVKAVMESLFLLTDFRGHPNYAIQFSYVEFIFDHTAPFCQIETYYFSRIGFKVMNNCWV